MTDEQKERMKSLYEMALLSQGACNLSGLAYSLAEAMEMIWMEAREQGQATDYVNSHPTLIRNQNF